MLKYQLPLMIISNTKDIFLKRIKRMKKMVASDCSSQESSEHPSERSSQVQSFSSSNFLKTIRSNQLDSSEEGEDSLIKNVKKSERSYDTSVHDVFEDQTVVDLSDTLYRPAQNQMAQQFKIKQTAFQNGLAHLIFDLDDIDKDRALKQYKKIQQRESIRLQGLKPKDRKSQISKKSSIIITAIDHNPVGDLQSQSSGANLNYYPKNSKNMKKQSGINRYKQQYDQTIRVSNYNNFATTSANYNYNSRNAVRQPGPSIRSPSFGSSPNFVQGNSTQRNYSSIQSGNQHQQQHPNIRYQQPAQTRKYAPREVQRQRIYTQNPYPTSSSYLHPNPYTQSNNFQNLNQIPSEENQTIYLTHQNSVSQVSNKAQKKQLIREKAVALLQKVKSQEKLPIFYEQQPKRLTKYQSRNRIVGYQ